MFDIDSIKVLKIFKPSPSGVHAETVMQADDFTAILLIVTAILLIFALTSRRYPVETQWMDFLTKTPINRYRSEAQHDSIMRTLGINGALGIVTGLLIATQMPYESQIVILLCTIGYTLLKYLLHRAITALFWNETASLNWCHDYNLLIILEGVFITIATFFAISGDFPTIYLFLTVGVVKILMLYRLIRIFSKGIESYLGIFLYFCTLEILALALVYNFSQI